MKKILLLCLLLCGCNCSPTTGAKFGYVEETKIENVKRVFMNTDCWYTLYVEGENGEIRHQKLTAYENIDRGDEKHRSEIVLVEDVPPEEDMWVECKTYYLSRSQSKEGNPYYCRHVIHIHSVDEANAGIRQETKQSGKQYITTKKKVHAID